MKIIAALKAAVPYLHDADVAANFHDLLVYHEEDLQEVGFEESTRTEKQIKSLTEAMDRFDENVADRRETLKDAIADSQDDEEEK